MAGKRGRTRASGSPRPASGIIGTGRIEAFSDGVFAIAATLLVLQLDLPHLPADVTDAQLWDALWQVVPSYFSLVLSFAVIGRYWAAHHSVFSRIGRSDGTLLTLNLLFLLTIIALPFPTEVLGDYGNLGAASIFYAASISLIGLSMALLWRHAVRRGLLVPGTSRVMIANTYRRTLAVPAIFLASVPVLAFVSVTVGQLMWLLLFFAGFLLKPEAARTR